MENTLNGQESERSSFDYGLSVSLPQSGLFLFQLNYLCIITNEHCTSWHLAVTKIKVCEAQKVKDTEEHIHPRYP